jgi:hypothetical protein
MGSTRARLAAAAVFVAGSLAASAGAAVPVLSVGDAHFWEGTFGASARGGFEVALRGGGHRLRVAVDHPGTTDAFDVEVYDPSGTRVAAADHEAFVAKPGAGTWRIDVVRRDADADAFRLRAKLEARPPIPDPPVVLRPNLRAEPGYDFTLSWPGATCAVAAVGCSGSPVPLPPSCAPDETAEDRAVRCLRFSFGYQNAGPGPLDLRFGSFDPTTRSVEVRQRIFFSDATPYDYSDNEYVERAAARATYHEIHGHFHYDNVFGARLFAVVDEERGEIEPVAEVAKRGACAHDVVFVDFERFYQAPQHSADSGTDCNFSFTNPTSPAVRIGLSSGWADIYPANLSDNYVDFGLNEDGLYLVRVKADVDDTIAETNERDNFGYSLIRVEGLTVELLERGRGRSPWDGGKVVLRGLGD